MGAIHLHEFMSLDAMWRNSDATIGKLSLAGCESFEHGVVYLRYKTQDA